VPDVCQSPLVTHTDTDTYFELILNLDFIISDVSIRRGYLFQYLGLSFGRSCLFKIMPSLCIFLSNTIFVNHAINITKIAKHGFDCI